MTIRRPRRPAVITVSAEEVKTLLAALDDAAGYKRGRVAICADCTDDQPCTTCQWRLQDIDAYYRMATQMIQAGEAAGIWQRTPGHAAPDRSGPHATAGPEAGL